MGKRVLVVDDSSMMRKMIVKTLSDGGHAVVGEAKSGKEAVIQYRALKPEVVTMDITMRDMDGFAAAREILRYDKAARIIFLSNLEEDKYRQEVEKIGAKAFVSKHAAEKILTVLESL